MNGRELARVAASALGHNRWIGAPEGEAILAALTPPEGTRLVLVSEDLLGQLGSRTEDGRRITAEWGEPDAWNRYTPTFTVHDEDAA